VYEPPSIVSAALISYILPVYNGAAFVRETVNSVYSQELDQLFEVVAVDDGSSDDSLAVLREIEQERGDSFRVIEHGTNKGEGAARNTAIRASEGDLLYIVDADNVLPAGMVQREVDWLREKGAAAVSVSELRIFRSDTADIEDVSPVSADGEGVSGLNELITTWRTPASHGNYLMKREVFDAVGGYQEGLTMSAWTFCMQHIVRGHPVHVAPETYYFHRVGHEGNWLRGERLGINDRLVLQALRSERERLPADLRAKVDALKDDDAFFTYLEEGRLLPGGNLPSRRRRAATRLRRQALRRYRRIRG
jgi:glycosyltransferase involved in cell wall biosynthesis